MKQLYLLAVFVVLNLIFSSTVKGYSSLLVKNKTQLELEKKAVAIAEEALLELSSLESSENQIVVLTLAADVFWTRDEKRARQMAQETAAKIRAALNPTLESNEAVRAYLVYPGNRYNRLRHDFLVMLARNDAAFAQELAANTRPLLLVLSPANQSEQNQLRNWNFEERDLEQKIAFQLAASNVSEAVKIARQSLTRGISQESLNLLRRLQIKNGEAASGFADEQFKSWLSPITIKILKRAKPSLIYCFSSTKRKASSECRVRAIVRRNRSSLMRRKFDGWRANGSISPPRSRTKKSVTTFYQ